MKAKKTAAPPDPKPEPAPDAEEVARRIATAKGGAGKEQIAAILWLREHKIDWLEDEPESAPEPPPIPPNVVLATSNGKTRIRGKDEKPDGSLVVTRLSNVKAEKYEWLWPGRFPYGEPVMLFGDCDLGKSMLTINLAATVTTGGRWPDLPDLPGPEAGEVLFIQDEDSLDKTLRPRVEAAGGDPERIHVLEHIQYPGDRIEDFSLSQHSHELEKGLANLPKVRLIIIDPVSAYLGAGVDGDNTPQVRRSLRPLARIARSRKLAVVMVGHPNKGGGTKAKYRASGSAAFTQAPRAVYMVAADPDDADRRLMTSVKFNCGPKPDTMAYGFDGPRIVWEPEPVLGVTADGLLAREAFLLARAGKRGPVPRKRALAEDWLKRRLADGPVIGPELFAEAASKGINESTLRRAMETCKVNSASPGGRGAPTFYQLGELPLNGATNGAANGRGGLPPAGNLE